MRQGRRMRTNPEALQAVPRAKGERDAEREREDVVREHVEERAELLPAQSAQHAAARAGEAVGDLERGDERHHFAHELHDRLVVAEEITKDLFVLFSFKWEGGRGRQGETKTHVFGREEGQHDDCSC